MAMTIFYSTIDIQIEIIMSNSLDNLNYKLVWRLTSLENGQEGRPQHDVTVSSINISGCIFYNSDSVCNSTITLPSMES